MGTTNYSPANVLGVRVLVDGSDASFSATRALFVVDVTCHARANTAGGAMGVYNAASPITDLMDCSGSQTLARCTTLDTTQQSVASGGTINVNRTGTPQATVVIYCLPGTP